jgi:hypothetical protein
MKQQNYIVGDKQLSVTPKLLLILKCLMVITVLLVTSLAAADNYKLEFDGPTQIVHHSNDWRVVAQTSQYNLGVDVQSIGTGDSVVAIYTLVDFTKSGGDKIDGIGSLVQRIYSYGIIECKNKLFNILNDWFVDSNGQIVYNQVHSVDAYLVDMSTPDTPRNLLLQSVCSTS